MSETNRSKNPRAAGGGGMPPATPQGGDGAGAPHPPGVSPWRALAAFAALVLAAWYVSYLTTGPQEETLTYSQFKARVEAGEVRSVTLKGDHVSGRLAVPAEQQGGSRSGAGEDDGAGTSADGRGGDAAAAPDGAGSAADGDAAADASEDAGAAARTAVRPFESTLPPVQDDDLIPLLEEHGVEIDAEPTGTRWWLQALIGLLPWILIIGLFWYGTRAMRQNLEGGAGPGGIFSVGKSKAKRFDRTESTVRFDDVAGNDDAKQDLQEITRYLQEPEQFRALGAQSPRGVLLMGPPGTGKTLLAKAMAGEAGVPFYSISGSEFIEMFVGVGASRVRDMFDSAKKEAPSIIFIDEIDSIGRARGAGLGGGHDEREQTLNQILGEMDGFEPHEAVVVLAATNRPDVLDAALTRPGRFDRKITLNLPDRRARRRILDIHGARVALDENTDLDRMAALTVGFSGADLENLVNEAALLAGRDDKARVDTEAFLAARDKLALGGQRRLALSDAQRRLIAWHESGHALAAALLPNADALDKVTIVPRGRALGATQQIPEEERYTVRESDLHDRIAVMLAGRVSEQEVFGEVSSGAESDLEQATGLVRRMVARWGMSEKLGPVSFQQGQQHVFLGREMGQSRDYSEHTARVIDDEVRRVITDIEQSVAELLRGHRAQLDRLAETLLEEETLGAERIRELLDEADGAAAQGQDAHPPRQSAEDRRRA